jgi:UDP-N-acetyl-2-amino-2-deoxyglucuronate dehydrogenase
MTPRRVPEKFRVGVVGCGMVSRNHIEAYLSAEDAELVAVCDLDEDAARRVAQRYGIPRALGAVEDLLALEPDVVSVCTPHPTHEAVVTAAAAARSHVVCEKPIAVDLASARRMVEACERADVELTVMFQRRFWPASQRLHGAIEDGTLGTPVLGQCSVLLHRDPSYYSKDAWRGTWATDGGGVLMTQAIHYIDLLQWYLGEVREVFGRVNTYRHGENIEVEDSATATLTFASGALATVQASTAASPALGAQVRVTGSTGASVQVTEFPEGTDGRLDLWAADGRIVSEKAQPDDVDPNADLGTINAALIPHHRSQIEEFLRSLRDGRPPTVSGRDALASLKIVLAVYESARTGRPVAFGGSVLSAVTVPNDVTASESDS